MSFTDALVAPLVAGAVPTVLSVWVTLSARKAKRLAIAQVQQVNAVKADAEAYTRAQQINQEIVDELRREIDRQQKELIQVRRLLRASQTRNAELERHVAELQRTVNRMTALLERHGIETPEGTPP